MRAGRAAIYAGFVARGWYPWLAFGFVGVCLIGSVAWPLWSGSIAWPIAFGVVATLVIAPVIFGAATRDLREALRPHESEQP